MKRWVGAVALLLAVLVAVSRLKQSSMKRTRLSDLGRYEDTSDASGTKFTFVSTPKGEACNTEPFILEGYCRPGAPGALPGRSASPPYHIHTRQEECFTILSGRLAYDIEGKMGELGPEDTQHKPLCIQPGRDHTFWNARNDTELRVQVKLQPALDAEKFFKTFCGLGADNGEISNVNPVQLLMTLVYGDMSMKTPVWPAVRYVMTPLAQLFGLQPFYNAYTDA